LILTNGGEFVNASCFLNIGANGKITHEELSEVLKTYKLQGLPKRTNQDERDAALLAINLYLKEN